MSMTISVRYEPKQDIDFITGVLGLTMSETLRSLIDEGRKMKVLQLYRHGKVSLGLGAKVAKLTLSEFIDLLKEHNVKLNIDVEDAKSALCVFEGESVSGELAGRRDEPIGVGAVGIVGCCHSH